jgi:hypothetical protein
MTGPTERLRTRLLPAALTALGVTILAAGLMSYTDPVLADPTTSAAPSPTVAGAVTPSPRLSLPPLETPAPGTPSPATSPTVVPNPDRVATRVRITALGIDLPIIKGPDGYPPCDVAMYLKELSQPGENKATYLFAHARPGMFEPLLKTKGRQQRGSVVEVWTNDDYLFRYTITEVRRAQRNLNDAFDAQSEQLWLQTSEGPKGTPGKTQVIALALDVTAADPADAHPRARPRDCG